MAIEAGNKVSTTGLVNKRPFTPKAPDMSKMKVPEAMKAKGLIPRADGTKRKSDKYK